MSNLWEFAVALYGRPGVAPSCLRLQDEAGLDIPLLLFSLWAARARGVALTPEDLAAIDRIVAPWREDIVAPLRAVRRRLKQGPSPAPSPGTEALRDKLKKVELGAEAIEIEMLEAALPDRSSPGADPLQNAVAVFVSATGRQPDEAERTLLRDICVLLRDWPPASA